jgi:hypothetical protein
VVLAANLKLGIGRMRNPAFVVALVSAVSIANLTAAQIPVPIPPPPTVEEAQELLGESRADLATRTNALREGKAVQGWTPVQSESDAVAFWLQDGASALNAGAVTIEKDVVAANVDLVSDIIGPFKVSFGVIAAGGEAESEEPETQQASEGADLESISRLAGQGGTAHLSAYWPAFFSSRADRKQVTSLVVVARSAFDSPQQGQIIEDPAATAMGGLDFLYRRMGYEGRLNFELSAFAHGYVYNDTYATKLGYDRNTAGIVGVRGAIILGRTTSIGVLFRPIRSDVFEPLSAISVYVQQVKLP